MDISWQQYDEMVHELDRKIRSAISSRPIGLIGIPRGGLLVALHLTYLDSGYEDRKSVV